jgi:hypothetical protein
MTRKGKIARLPYSIRGLLNEKLCNGEAGTKNVTWLNALPRVLEVLVAEFGAREVTEQNLSEWRQGGYEDRLKQQESLDWVRELASESEELEEQAGDCSVAGWLSAPVGVILWAGASRKSTPARWKIPRNAAGYSTWREN